MTSQPSASATLADVNEFYAMFADLFTDKQDCSQDDVLKCNSFKRIKILLKQCDDIVNETQLVDLATQNKIHDLIHHQLGQDVYTNTDLLNDFHHIKYEHGVEDDVDKFDHIFRSSSYQNCNISNCKYLKHHYRDRTQISVQNDNTSNSYSSNLLSRVHTYFTHSYDLNKLTVDEINKMNQELNAFKITIQSDDDHEVLLQQKKLEMLFEIMNNKKGKALKTVSNKYIEPAQEKYQLFSDVLVADDDLDALLKFFDENEYDTEAVHNDLEEKQQSNICTYFQEKLKDKINQIDVLREVLSIYIPVIQASNLLDHDQQNKTFLLTQFCGFTGSTPDAAKTFLDATNWDLTLSINRYFMFDGDPSKMEMSYDRDVNSTDENNHHRRESTKFEALDFKELQTGVNQDIYSLGTKFWYWLSMKNQPNYIPAKHKDLKFEILYHNEIACNVSSWNSLDEECNVKLSSNKVRRMMSNGYNIHIYAVKDNIRFDLDHIRALLLYTNYTAWCSFFCGVLRKANKAEISTVATWAKLLIECVQCYGCLISADDTFYRGINREFTFQKFVARFNVPLSTTTALIKAAEFADFAASSDGLVVELCFYDIINTVFTLDCSVISAFTEEREMLFYGGDTILRIQSIHQLVDNKWKSYEDFVKATDGITRLMNGLQCKTGLTGSVKKAMRFIFRSILNTSNKTNIKSLPKYIAERLINYHIVDRKAAVEMEYDELIARYTWIHSIFVKDKDKGILNIYNICRIFHKSNAIIITMPDASGNTKQNIQQYEQSRSNILDVAGDDAKEANGKVTQQFCQSLKDDLHRVANDEVFINKLQFNWSTKIQLEAKFLLTNVFANDKLWKLESTSTSILITRREPEDEDEKVDEEISNNNTQDAGAVQGLDDENESDVEFAEEEEFMTFVWEIEEKEFDNFRKTGECKSDEIEIEEEKYNAYKWEWALRSTGTEAELTLTLKSLPEQIGAAKMNIDMSCDELLYVENHEGVVLTLRDELRIKLKDKFETNVVVTFDLDKFEKEHLKKLKFKCNIEILVNYDLWGGIFSEIEKPLFVARSQLNNLLVYGFINEIHEYNSQKIKASPLSIYELIYKYYLMMIKITGKGGLFVW
eukprot:431273_1